jgi:rare lipoprotein A
MIMKPGRDIRQIAHELPLLARRDRDCGPTARGGVVSGIARAERLGRIVDLSPSTAEKIGITQDNGIAKVKVTPISVPLPNGSTKRGIETPDSKP